MSESVVLCEGFHDRAFWDGWLTHLGCNSNGFKPGTPAYPATDPWGHPVRRGQFAYRSKSGGFVRVRECRGRSNILREVRIRLMQRSSERLMRLVIVVDVDTSAGGTTPALTGLRHQDVLTQIQKIDPQAIQSANWEIDVDGGATKISLIRWEVADPPAPGVPDKQTLERLVCAALAAADSTRALAVQNWLDSRPTPPPIDPKEHAWSYMAGWFAEQGCERFFTGLWSDARVAAELELRLRSSDAWQIAEQLAN